MHPLNHFDSEGYAGLVHYLAIGNMYNNALLGHGLYVQ